MVLHLCLLRFINPSTSVVDCSDNSYVAQLCLFLLSILFSLLFFFTLLSVPCSFLSLFLFILIFWSTFFLVAFQICYCFCLIILLFLFCLFLWFYFYSVSLIALYLYPLLSNFLLALSQTVFFFYCLFFILHFDSFFIIFLVF